jgi:hypothetical protein
MAQKSTPNSIKTCKSLYWTYNCPVSSIGKALDRKLATRVQFPNGTDNICSEFDQKSFLQSFVLYICSSMYRSYQFLVKVKATSTGSLSRNDVMAWLCSGKLKMAYYSDPEGTQNQPNTKHMQCGSCPTI